MATTLDTTDFAGGGGGFDPTSIIGGAISGIGNIIGANINAESQHETNQANIASAREQMAFQERMSSSSYQRGISDMKAAGLNPALAYSQGGASSPGGSMATSIAPKRGDAVSAIGGGIGTAVALHQQKAQTDKIESDTKLNTNVDAIQKAQHYNLQAEGRISSAQAAKAEAEAEFYKSDFGKKYAIPLRETLGLGSSAANIMSSGVSIMKALKPSSAGAKGVSDFSPMEKAAIENSRKYKRKLP